MLSTLFWWRPAIVVLALASPALAQEGLRWEDNLDAARRLAAQTNRLVLLHFTAPWCEPCQRLEQQVFSQPGFGHELVGNFVAVKINVDNDPTTARQCGVQKIPADAVITPRGELIQMVESPRTGPEYIGAMQRIGAAGLAPPRDPSRPDATAVDSPPSPPLTAQGSIAQPSGREPADPRFIPASNPTPHSAAGPDERYTEYYDRRRADAAARTAAPYVDQPAAPMDDRYAQRPAVGMGAGSPGSPGAPPATQDRFRVLSPAAPPSQQDRYAVQPPVAPPTTWTPGAAGQSPPSQPPPGAGVAVREPAAPPHPDLKLPPGCAPLGLDGYCPVSLCEKPDVWTMGDTRWGVQHRGRTYLFAGPEQQKKFLANPNRYSPVLSGDDPVLALDHGQSVPGSRSYGGFFGDRIYLFSSEATYQQFSQNPNRYAAEVYKAEVTPSMR
jgi:YHS domain-containing protein/thiol-disulfide isomerase/thioredoxin